MRLKRVCGRVERCTCGRSDSKRRKSSCTCSDENANHRLGGRGKRLGFEPSPGGRACVLPVGAWRGWLGSIIGRASSGDLRPILGLFGRGHLKSAKAGVNWSVGPGAGLNKPRVHRVQYTFTYLRPVAGRTKVWDQKNYRTGNDNVE